MIKRAPRQPTHRTRLPISHTIIVPALTWVATISAGDVLMTLNLPMSISGLPVGITVQGVAPIGYTPVSATSFKLHYTAAVVSTNALVVPANVPQVRGQAGGTLAAGSYTFP